MGGVETLRGCLMASFPIRLAPLGGSRYDWVWLFGVNLLQLNVSDSLSSIILSIQIVVTSHEHDENKTKGSCHVWYISLHLPWKINQM